MLHFILGRSGSGKSRRVLKELSEFIHRGETALLLVPEQYTVQAEQDLMNEASVPGLLKVQVQSPSRLARDVLHRAGLGNKACISGLGKAMAVRRAAGLHRDELSLFGGSVRYPRFCGELAELFGDLCRFDTTPQALCRALSGEEESLLSRKLHDLSIIYEETEKLLSAGNTWDADIRTDSMIESIPMDEVLRNVHVYMDGFDYLPPQSVRMILALAEVCPEVTLTLACADPADRDADIFAAGFQSFERIREEADRRGIAWEAERVSYAHEERPEVLRYLEKNLFVFPQIKAGIKDNESVKIMFPRNTQEELENCAGEIQSLVYDGSHRYSDIAVLCADLAQEGPELKQLFREWGIPCFLDDKRSVLSHPASELLLSALTVIARGWKDSDVLRTAKSGLLPFTPEEVGALEIYLEASKRRGKARMTSPWNEKRDSWKEFSLTEIQEKLIAPLDRLNRKTHGSRGTSATEWADAITDLLNEWSFTEQLEALAQTEEELGMTDAAQATGQMGELISDLLEQIRLILGDECLKADEVCDLLEAGLGSAQLGILPALTDGVMIGNIGRTKLSEVKVLMILGAADNVFPNRYAEGAILNDMDMARLNDHDMAVGRDAGIRSAQSRYAVYSALAKPSEKVFLMCPNISDDGDSIQHSRILDRIMYMLDLERYDPLRSAYPVPELRVKEAAEAIRRLNNNGNPVGDWKGTLAALWQNPDYRARIEKMREGIDGISESVDAGSLRIGRTSVSKLGTYAGCPFEWFIKYEIDPQKWDTLQADAASEGTVIHAVLEKYVQGIIGKEELPDEEKTSKRIDEILDEILAQDEAGAPYRGTALAEYRAIRVREIVQKTGQVMLEHLNKGKFRPAFVELKFKPNERVEGIPIKLSDGSVTVLEGMVDRVDVYRDEASNIDYIRIIDYKSGVKDMKFSEVKDGTQLQLWLYLDAICSKWKEMTGHEARPAGVFYFPARDEYESEDDPDKAEEAAPVKMNGAVSEYIGSAEMDPTIYTKKNPFNKDSTLPKDELLHAVCRGAKQVAAELLNEERLGHTAPHPLGKVGDATACKFCEYKTLCGKGLRDIYGRRESSSEEAKSWIEELSKETENDGMDK